MMDFRTQVQIPEALFRIDHFTKMMLFGSCFSENIGKKLVQNKLHVDINPFGILYNPLSVSSSIRRLLQKIDFTESDIVYNNELYHSFMHHGSFSDTEKHICLNNISFRYNKAADCMAKTDLFLITFGSAHVYRLKRTEEKGKGEIVSNCHKFPEDNFERTRLSVEEIVVEWSELIRLLRNINPNVKFIFTVSPIRHWKDGAHENQISKSILHIAIDQLISIFGDDLLYFSAYEIMIDELRDYRFYDEGMMHPTTLAIDFIWDVFSRAYFSDTTKVINKEWTQLRKSIDHKPLFPDTNSYSNFLKLTFNNLERFTLKYPHINCEHEIQQISTLLSSLDRD